MARLLYTGPLTGFNHASGGGRVHRMLLPGTTYDDLPLGDPYVARLLASARLTPTPEQVADASPGVPLTAPAEKPVPASPKKAERASRSASSTPAPSEESR